MKKQLTDEQRIKLAGMLGWKHVSTYFQPDGPTWSGFSKEGEYDLYFDLFNPDSPEGVKWLRDLWLKLNHAEQSKVINLMMDRYIKPDAMLQWHEFMTWFFENPCDACLLILEVVE